MNNNHLLCLSTILILAWGVEFTSDVPLSFSILAINLTLMAFSALLPYYYTKTTSNIDYKLYWPYCCYVIWFAICAVRGLSDLRSTYQSIVFFKYIVAGLLTSSIFVADNIYLLRTWINMLWKYGWIVAIVLFPFNISYSFYFHYLLVIIIFWPIISKNNKIWILAAIVFALRYLDPRSHLLKYGFVILIFAVPYIKHIEKKLIKAISIVCLLLPFGLLYTGVTGIFNPFKMEDYINTDLTFIQNGETYDFTVDTRTVIFQDAFYSALIHGEIIQGANIANGNDSSFNQGDQRFFNEICVLNHFTKLGVIGVILLFLIFVRAVHLSVFHSNNSFVPLVGLFSSVRWVLMWVEDIEQFSCCYLSIWLMLGICYSASLRNMNDVEFLNWAQSFSFHKKSYGKRFLFR